MKTRMKKIIVLAAAAVMAITMSLTAFALPSPTVSGLVKGVSSVTDAKGNSVQVIVETIPEAETQESFTAEEKAAVEEIKNEDNLKEVMGSAWEDGMQLVDIQNVRIEGDASLVTFPVTITFTVTGVTEQSNVEVLHFDTNVDAWEVVDSKAGPSSITATFPSLSPVAFVVDADTAKNMEAATTGTTSSSGSTGTTTTSSPKTGKSDLPIYAGLAAVALIGGTALIIYKKGKHAA